jgi:hypothetical protein
MSRNGVLHGDGEGCLRLALSSRAGRSLFRSLSGQEQTSGQSTQNDAIDPEPTSAGQFCRDAQCSSRW